MTRSKVILPRGYLSHSQIDCVNRSEREYIAKYIYGETSAPSIHQEFGTTITDILEGRTKMPKKLEAALKDVPRYAKNDHEISCMLHRGRGKYEFRLMGRLDGWNKNCQGEYKTGMVPWDAARVQKSRQLKIYALIEYRNSKVIPMQKLTWLESEWDGAEIRLTGRNKTFTVQFSLGDILETEAWVWEAHDKITRFVETELAKI